MRPAWRIPLAVGLLVAAFVGSALGAVYARHESRKLFMQLSALTEERDRLEMDWSRLQMEQSAWSSHARVEELARGQMHMRNPRGDEVELVAP